MMTFYGGCSSLWDFFNLQAQAVTLTIAQSFTMAYELWQMSDTKLDSLPMKTDNSSDTHNEDDPIKGETI